MKAQLFAFNIHAVHSSDLAFNYFGCEILNQLFDHLIFNGALINRIRREAFQKSTDLGRDNL